MTHISVAEMAAAILDDPSAKERVEQLVTNRTLIEHRRDAIAENIKKSRNEFARGEVEKGTANDLMRDTFENEKEE
jgi:hypothetical protein